MLFSTYLVLVSANFIRHSHLPMAQRTLQQTCQEGGVGGLATLGPATFGGLRHRPEIYKIRQNVLF